ncbi:glycoside hydrolase family 127 protein [Sporolactobacillus shoreicorticis]|uniref:Glycoside hydrolase family 127 protein n=1 Tax=Sporolactobacillus shoreicorticis TaxID=1923877 RepID=A0ABW5S158_9BACL|nr:beta-L-arabinofuranosidase domain-containing protein [Sporolactobacillus shoreicorticis]MCO7127481.1 glycoside hydrolase family 127 protein [Sporolactobacillus shoreicorticis]
MKIDKQNIRMTCRSPKNILLTDKFWKRYRDLVKKKMIPYQWSVMNDQADIKITKERGDHRIPSEKSHAVANFEIAAGKQKGGHYGYVFQDTDAYKWLEAVAYLLTAEPDRQLQKVADRLVDLIADAQQDDGYLVTFFIIEAPERKFKRLKQSHELYSMGHYIEAGIAYYEATGSQKALNIAKRMADCIHEHFGPGKEQIHGFDGHPEIELALAKLYEATGNEQYLELARYFLYQRGQDPQFLDRQIEADGADRHLIAGMEGFPLSYYQADQPILDQKTAEGHAVRVAYLCTGMAHVAKLTHDDRLYEACKRLWKNIVGKRMYITGGIGATSVGESFTFDYDLPNDTMYCETCASVAMSFFARRMLEIEPKGEYADVLEKELFNSTISGVSLDGEHFFYVNPLEVSKEASQKDPGKSHVMFERQNWFGCACCPPNLARLIASVDQYIYTVDPEEKTIYSHQFIANRASFEQGITIEQSNNYPWDGTISYTVSNPEKARFKFSVRIPGWSAQCYDFYLSGKKISKEAHNGYAIFDVTDERLELELKLDMRVREMQADNHVKTNLNKVAIQRGPIIYCMEEADNTTPLNLYQLPKEVFFTENYEPDLLRGVVAIEADALRDEPDDADASLYHEYQQAKKQMKRVRFIPYYAWINRKSGEMQVWTRKAD